MIRNVTSIAVLAAGSLLVFACGTGSSDGGATEGGPNSAASSGGSGGYSGSSSSGGGAFGTTGSSSGFGAFGSSGSSGAFTSGASGSSGGSGSSGSTATPVGSSGAGGNSASGSSSGPSSGSGGVPTSGGSSSSSGGAEQGSSSGQAASGSSSSGGSSGSSSGGSSSGAVAPCTPPTSGSAGYATRYWDCCKPSCGSSHTCASDGVTRNDGAKDSCQGGDAYECYDMSPQVVSDSLAYAFAAYDGASCGTCFQLTFTGKSNDGTMDTGSQDICGKSIIVQVVNTGGLQSGQFDLLIPGGGVGANDACASQWGVSSSQLGVQYGGLMLQCEQQDNYNYSEYPACTTSACQSIFSKSATMETGCEFIINWMKGANNPSMKYTQVSCPSQLTSISGL